MTPSFCRCLIAPFVAYPLTYRICKEMQGTRGAGKRKTANVVTRTTEGEYVAEPAPAYADDVADDLEPTEVPRFIEEPEVTASESGVRIIER